MIKEFKNIISNKNISILLKEINDQKFPFYLVQYKKLQPRSPFLYHVVLKRPEHKKPHDTMWNSAYGDLFLQIFKDFCKKAKIYNTEIYRACLNLTFWTGEKQCGIHQDHNYPHRQLIIYLNNADPKSKTIIVNDKNKIIKEIIPKKNKGVMFDNVPHYHIYPTFGYRLALIYTFK